MASGITVQSDLSPKIQAYYDKRFRIRVKNEVPAMQFGQKTKLKNGVGGNHYWNRFKPMAIRTTALTETTTGGISTPKHFTTDELLATITSYGDYAMISRLASLTQVDQAAVEKTDVMAQQCAESVDKLIMTQLGARLARIRADGDGTYQAAVATTSAGAAGGTTIVSTALTQADDFWNNGYVTIMSPELGGYGETRKIEDFTQSTGTITVDTAFSTQIASGTKVHVWTGVGTVAGDVFGDSPLRLATRFLRRARAMRMPGGYFVALVDPDVEYDFMGDNLWQDAKSYSDTGDLYQGEIGKWRGVRCVGTTLGWRETVNDTTYAASHADDLGALHCIPILGAESYGIVDVEGTSQSIYARRWDQLGQPIPLYDTFGWRYDFDTKVLNGSFGVNVCCGATA